MTQNSSAVHAAFLSACFDRQNGNHAATKHNNKVKTTNLYASLKLAALGVILASTCLAGHELKWNEVPKRCAPRFLPTEYKYYAPDVGVVREVPVVGDIRLVSHTGR